MEHMIDVDFSKLEKNEKNVISATKKTIWIAGVAGVILMLFTMGTAWIVCGEKPIWEYLVLLYMIFVFIWVALFYLIYKMESIRTSYVIEDAKTDAALCRKLAEEAIMREIKIQEKEISDAQKHKQAMDTYKDIESNLTNLKLLHSIKNDDDCKREINNTIQTIANKLSELKN